MIAARRALAEFAPIRSESSVYETSPMYVTDQACFWNGAWLVETDQSPRRLLERLHRIESDLGRTRTKQYGPRPIDLDLVAYGCLNYRFQEPGARPIEVPHPRMGERRFVLEPMIELGVGCAWKAQFETLSDQGCIRLGTLDTLAQTFTSRTTS